MDFVQVDEDARKWKVDVLRDVLQRFDAGGVHPRRERSTHDLELHDPDGPGVTLRLQSDLKQHAVGRGAAIRRLRAQRVDGSGRFDRIPPSGFAAGHDERR
jgi:hypothetical protein